MQSSHAPDYLDVADFTTAHCPEPKEYQRKSDEHTCSETGSAAGSSTPAVPQGDTVIAQTGSNEVRAYWRCCWDIEVSVSEVSKYKVTANTEALLNFQNKLLLLEEVHGI